MVGQVSRPLPSSSQAIPERLLGVTGLFSQESQLHWLVGGFAARPRRRVGEWMVNGWRTDG
jgi:hypothetical protein